MSQRRHRLDPRRLRRVARQVPARCGVRKRVDAQDGADPYAQVHAAAAAADRAWRDHPVVHHHAPRHTRSGAGDVQDVPREGGWLHQGGDEAALKRGRRARRPYDRCGTSLFWTAERSDDRVSGEGAHLEPLCQPVWLSLPSVPVGGGRTRLINVMALATAFGASASAATAKRAGHEMTSSASPWRIAFTICDAARRPSIESRGSESAIANHANSAR